MPVHAIEGPPQMALTPWDPRVIAVAEDEVMAGNGDDGQVIVDIPPTSSAQSSRSGLPPLPSMMAVNFELTMPPEMRGWFRKVVEEWEKEPAKEKQFYEVVDQCFRTQNKELAKLHRWLEQLAPVVEKMWTWEPHLSQMHEKVHKILGQMSENDEKNRFLIKSLEEVSGVQHDLKTEM